MNIPRQLALSFCLTLSLPSLIFAAEQRPNILLVMVNDMGYSDIGCYGGEIRSPTLDALAENGVRLARLFNCAQCCPSRASLMTGLYPHQAGVGDMNEEGSNSELWRAESWPVGRPFGPSLAADGLNSRPRTREVI